MACSNTWAILRLNESLCIMGSGAETVHETVETWLAGTKRWVWSKVRLYRPFSAQGIHQCFAAKAHEASPCSIGPKNQVLRAIRSTST